MICELCEACESRRVFGTPVCLFCRATRPQMDSTFNAAAFECSAAIDEIVCAYMRGRGDSDRGAPVGVD